MIVVGFTAAAGQAAEETIVLPKGAAWRVFLTAAKFPKHSHVAEGYTTAPPEDWQSPEFDAGRWGRYSTDISKAMGGYGSEQSPDRALICMRTGFGIEDPGKVSDLQLSMEYRGGVVVYVNGKEIARKHLPKGKLDHTTQADAYPTEAFVDPDGKHLRRASRPAEKHRDRYEKRIRSLKVSIPASALRKGDNVLALEIHSAPLKGMRIKSRDAWATAGFDHAELKTPSANGVISYSEALDKLTVNNATPMDTVATEPGRFRGGFLWWNMTVTPSGIVRGDPFEPLRPIKTVAPRGGTCSGQVVLSGPEGFSGLEAKISPLRLDGGNETLPADSVSLRYAHQMQYEEFCNTLSTKPADDAPVQPVWVLVDVPRDQKPGWYTGSLTLQHEKQSWDVPVQVLVSPWTVPDHKDNETLVSIYQSPETLADHYKVKPYSDEHFKLIEKSFRAMAKSGNDVLLVPVILGDYLQHDSGLIRWVKDGDSYKPDYSLLERYMDLHIKHFGKPKVVTLLVWRHGFGCRTWFRGMNNKTIEPIMVTQVDPKTGETKAIEAPQFGKPGSEKFWKTMIEGVREIVKKRGCSDEYLLLGEVFDSRPLEYTVEFFKKIAPEVRWQGYAHWVREPKPVDGKFIAHSGIEVGFKIGPNGGGLPELNRDWPEKQGDPKREYLIAQAERTTIHYESSPLTYRAVMYGDRDGGGTIARIGLDFWPSIRDSRGRLRSRYQAPPKEGWLWRGHCPALTGPGPEGAVITAQGQMFLEGLQETELAVQFARALLKASPEMKARIQKLDALRKDSWSVGASLSQATISLDWHGLAAREYVLGAELTGEKAENLWNNPPKEKK
ncbi:MAG: glycoside hydrolase domain-containing protein [Phycisphaerae bacterium]